MITGFIFDLLPVWLARLGQLARQSALYRLCAGIYHRFVQLIKQSFCARLWQGTPAVRKQIRTCATVHFLDGFLSLLTALAGKLAGPCIPLVQESLIGRTLCKLPGFNICWIYGFVILVCFLCPGELWRNQYALILSIALFALTFLVAWNEKRRPFRIADLGLGLVAFMFACLVGVGVSGSLSEGIRVLCFYLTSFFLCMSLLGTITTRQRLRAILGFVHVTLVVTGIIGFAQRIIGVEVSASLTDLVTNAGMPGRIYSTLENPNNYAEFIVLTFPISLVFCCTIPDRRWKTLAFMGLVFPVGALLMTYSRSGWVSFALAAVVFIALWDKRLLPVLAVAVLAALPILPDSIFNRILTIGSTADSSNMYRIYIWESVIRMIGDYGLTGIGLGPGNFAPVYALYCNPIAAPAPHSHMLYMEVWLEMGILGIVSFFAFYLGTIRKGIRTTGKTDPELRLVLIACVSSLAGIAFICAAEYIWYYPRVMFAFFILLGITLAALRLARAKK